MDDIILASNSTTFVIDLKTWLDSSFKLKDLQPLKFFLGLEVAQSASRISLCQRKYSMEVLADAGLLAAKPTTVPMDCNQRLNNSDGDSLDDQYLSQISRKTHVSYNHAT